MQNFATLNVTQGFTELAPSVGNHAHQASQTPVLIASSLHLMEEEADMSFGAQVNATTTTLRVVKNGEPCGTQNAVPISTMLLAAYVLLTAQLACLMLVSHVKSKPMEEELETLLYAPLIKKRMEHFATILAKRVSLVMGQSAGNNALQAQLIAVDCVSTQQRLALTMLKKWL